MAQSEWLRFVQSLPANQWILGATTDLLEFLFGSSRNALSRVRAPLRELQNGRCFYCAGPLHDAGAVGHFVPWSRYPRDLVHNFVARILAAMGTRAIHSRVSSISHAGSPGSTSTMRI